MRYSFAKTPLKAAQAPLAAARANQEGDLKLILLLSGGGGGRGSWVGVKGERRGSVAASIGEVFSREGVVWWRGSGKWRQLSTCHIILWFHAAHNAPVLYLETIV